MKSYPSPPNLKLGNDFETIAAKKKVEEELNKKRKKAAKLIFKAMLDRKIVRNRNRKEEAAKKKREELRNINRRDLDIRERKLKLLSQKYSKFSTENAKRLNFQEMLGRNITIVKDLGKRKKGYGENEWSRVQKKN